MVLNQQHTNRIRGLSSIQGKNTLMKFADQEGGSIHYASSDQTQ